MKAILISYFLLFALTQTKAQEVLTGVHGGRIKIIEGYKIETLGCDNYLEIYLYNEASEPLFNNGISGSVKFFYENKNLTYSVQPYGIDGFTCKIVSSDFSHYEVSLDLLNKLHLSASFNECIIPKQ
jgi:hypothetical protein